MGTGGNGCNVVHFLLFFIPLHLLSSSLCCCLHVSRSLFFEPALLLGFPSFVVLFSILLSFSYLLQLSIFNVCCLHTFAPLHSSSFSVLCSLLSSPWEGLQGRHLKKGCRANIHSTSQFCSALSKAEFGHKLPRGRRERSFGELIRYSFVRGLLGTGPSDPTSNLPRPQGSIWHRFNIDSTLIRHRFPDLTLFRCRINVESMLNRCQIDP